MPVSMRVADRAMGKQIVLPWTKAAAIALESMRVRFGRSLITASSIALACAFLAFIYVKEDLLTFLRALGDPDINFMLQKKGIDLESSVGVDSRAVWLIGTSLVVCLVGVSNALLMSVTERIKEIGTMKCLGALDTFVIKLFLLEALFMGTVSSFIGVTAGLALCFLVHAAEFGMAIFSGPPWFTITKHVAYTLAIGTLLSIVAAIYPSLMAARMQPVEALRKEV